MKSWLIVATLLVPAKALAGAVTHPAAAAPIDDSARTELLKDIEAARAALLPQGEPLPQVTARHQPKLDMIKKDAVAARGAAALQKVSKDFSDWKAVLLRELHADSRRAAPETFAAFSERKNSEMAFVSALRQQIAAQNVDRNLASMRAVGVSAPDPFAWSRYFDATSNAGGTPARVPFASPAADGAVRADIPTGAARYDKIRALLLSQGVSKQIVDLAIAEGIKQKVDPMIVLSVIHQESRFRKNAYNKGSGCVGLMQLDPDTAADMGVRGNLFDPAANIKAGVKYLNWIANSFFKMNQDLSDMAKIPADKMKMILASYNWGIGNVQKVVRKHGAAALDRVAPKETRNYIVEIPGRIRDWFAALW